jgi:hypothetical protein
MKRITKSEDLQDEIKKVLLKLNIPVEKLVGVIMDRASSIAKKNSGLSSHITNDVKNTAGCNLFVYHLENLCATSTKRPNVVTVLQNSLTLLNQQHWTIANLFIYLFFLM